MVGIAPGEDDREVALRTQRKNHRVNENQTKDGITRYQSEYYILPESKPLDTNLVLRVKHEIHTDLHDDDDDDDDDIRYYSHKGLVVDTYLFTTI